MLVVLSLILGLLLGAGGLFGFLKADEANAVKLGVTAASPNMNRLADSQPTKAPKDKPCPACAACPRCDAAGGGQAGYALVYPIEETLRVEGGLDEAAIREKIIRGRFEMQKCYQQQLKLKPSLAGELALQFTVSASGKVLVALARQNTVNGPELEQCVLKQIKSWTFERKPDSKDAVVKFDVLFAPLNGGMVTP
jgi:hypothetical protein